MPKVGTREFPYTAQGEKEAAEYAAATNQEIEHTQSYGYARGGEVRETPDIQGYLNSDDHKEWLNSPWDSEKDIHILKTILGAMHKHGGYDEENTQKYLEDYTAMLNQVSNKKDSPLPEELHRTLREMQYGKPTEGMQDGGIVDPRRPKKRGFGF